MSSLWKLSTPPAKRSGQPLENVACIGRAFLQPDSDMVNNSERPTQREVRSKQIRCTIRRKSACVKPSSKHENITMLSIDPRRGTVNVEKWSKHEISQRDMNRIRSSRQSEPSRRMSSLSQSASVSRATSAKTQLSQESKAGTRDSLSHLRVDPSVLNMELNNMRPTIHFRNRRYCLKPLKPVVPQWPSIYQCAGITPDSRKVRSKHQHGTNRAPVFRRFYEVMLEQPQRTRQERQRSAPLCGTSLNDRCGGYRDLHQDTSTPGYCLEVPCCSPDVLQLQLEGLCLHGDCGPAGEQRRCSSLPSSCPVRETCDKSLVSNDSADGYGCVSGRSLKDAATEGHFKDTNYFFITKWDPGQLKVTVTHKDSNGQSRVLTQKPST